MNVLVTPWELRALLDEPDLVLLDVRWYLTDPARGHREYLQGHLPGARFVAVEHEVSAHPRPDGSGGRHPLPSAEDFQAAMRRAGVHDHSTVVVYDQGPSLASGRLWWMLTDAGLPHVRVLDGGLAAWLEAGGPITSEVPDEGNGTFTVRPGHRERVDAAGVAAHLESGGTVLDVRAAERFRGEIEPIDPVAGHIPGAANLPASALLDDGRFHDPITLRSAFAGLQPGDVVSCGSGITAAQALLAAEHAGVTGLRLYPGSWSDWISDPARPVATGS